MPEVKEQAYQDYLKGMKYKDIASKYGVSLSTVKSWKQRYRWERKSMRTKNKKVCVQNKKDAPKKNAAKTIEDIQIENEELTEKQKLFCDYYIKYRNKTKAYMKAYQCSYENANAHAYELWDNVGVRNEIDKLLSEFRNNIKLDTQDITQKYIDIAFADITDYVEFGREEIPVMGPFGPLYEKKKKGEPAKPITKIVNVVKFKESSMIDGTIISEVKQGKDGASIKLQDKIKALEWLSNHIGELDTATKEKLSIEREKLKIEKAQKGLNDDDDNETGVVILPEVDYSLEGENNE